MAGGEELDKIFPPETAPVAAVTSDFEEHDYERSDLD